MAIYKKGAKSEAGNYRPVSLTSVICKILESIISDHTMEHLLRNKLLSNLTIWFCPRNIYNLAMELGVPVLINCAKHSIVRDIYHEQDV